MVLDGSLLYSEEIHYTFLESYHMKVNKGGGSVKTGNTINST